MSNELKDVINLMLHDAGTEITAFISAGMMDSMDYASVDIPVFMFDSRLAYQDFYIENDDGTQNVMRSTHCAYRAKLGDTPVDREVISKLFGHCVEHRLKSYLYNDPVLIVRQRPCIIERDESYDEFYTRFGFADKSWLSGAIESFDQWNGTPYEYCIKGY